MSLSEGIVKVIISYYYLQFLSKNPHFHRTRLFYTELAVLQRHQPFYSISKTPIAYIAFQNSQLQPAISGSDGSVTPAIAPEVV